MPLLQTQPHTHSAAPVAPEQSRGQRRTSFDPADFVMPTGREEEWRFTPVDRVRDLLADQPAGTAPTAQVSIDPAADASVTLTSISPAQARELGVLAPGDRPAALAFAGAQQVRLVDVAAGAQPTEPVVVTLTAPAGASLAHLVVRAGAGSAATVVLRHTGTARLSELVSVVVDEGASLRLVSLQEWDDDAVHLAEHTALVGRDAAYRHAVVTLGGHVVRVGATVRYAGPGGTAELLGVYFADDGQHLEHRSFVDHNAAHCTSNVLYKGALQGETAHTVWVGDVLIRAQAAGTSTYELNRNLLLSGGARADSVPNLEIETGEIVGAGHASANGRFDDEQLFYLMARGIPFDQARRLVVRGFFADVVARLGVAQVEEEIMTAVEAELAMAEPAEVTR